VIDEIESEDGLEPLSKTKQKKEALDRQHLGAHLVELPPTKLDKLPMSDPLRQAIDLAKTIKSHGAKKRQAQYIGKLMRHEENYEALLEAYEELQNEGKANTAHFHALEVWRDRLIQEGKPALTAFVAEYTPENIQKLRHHIDKAIQEFKTTKPVGAMKALFRYLRELT
jgi:ribosome-associated protein